MLRLVKWPEMWTTFLAVGDLGLQRARALELVLEIVIGAKDVTDLEFPQWYPTASGAGVVLEVAACLLDLLSSPSC
jgi:hypothetical protein